MPAATTLRRRFSKITAFAVLPLLLFAIACEDIGVGSDDPVETRDQTFQVNGPVTLDIDSFNGNIIVTSFDSNSVRVQATLKRADKIDYRVTQFGNDIQLKARQSQSTSLNAPSVSVEITAPANSELILRTSNGSVEVRNFEAGAIIRTSNGRITVAGMRGDLEADTSNGSIDVSNFTGAVTLGTSNGSIRFAGKLVPGSRNDMETSNGSITIDLDNNPSVLFDGSTSNGTVSSDFPVLTTSTGRTHLEGKIGDGEAELTATTSNGSITVK